MEIAAFFRTPLAWFEAGWITAVPKSLELYLKDLKSLVFPRPLSKLVTSPLEKSHKVPVRIMWTVF